MSEFNMQEEAIPGQFLSKRKCLQNMAFKAHFMLGHI